MAVRGGQSEHVRGQPRGCEARCAQDSAQLLDFSASIGALRLLLLLLELLLELDGGRCQPL